MTNTYVHGRKSFSKLDKLGEGAMDPSSIKSYSNRVGDAYGRSPGVIMGPLSPGLLLNKALQCWVVTEMTP